MFTADFSGFKSRELRKAARLLNLWSFRVLTDFAQKNFYNDGITVNFNDNSGYVFLSNSDYQALVEEDGKLEMLLYCPNCGNEGTPEEFKLCGDECCKEYLESYVN